MQHAEIAHRKARITAAIDVSSVDRKKRGRAAVPTMMPPSIREGLLCCTGVVSGIQARGLQGVDDGGRRERNGTPSMISEHGEKRNRLRLI